MGMRACVEGRPCVPFFECAATPERQRAATSPRRRRIRGDGPAGPWRGCAGQYLPCPSWVASRASRRPYNYRIMSAPSGAPIAPPARRIAPTASGSGSASAAPRNSSRNLAGWTRKAPPAPPMSALDWKRDTLWAVWKRVSRFPAQALTRNRSAEPHELRPNRFARLGGGGVRHSRACLYRGCMAHDTSARVRKPPRRTTATEHGGHFAPPDAVRPRKR